MPDIARYIITESGPAVSLDPLDADNTENLPVARMLYATPVEISANDILSSQVLDHFEYDSKTYQIRMSVRQGLKFSDGTALTVKDVELAILRMAQRRPDFPVIRYIKGVNEWSSLPSPLKSSLSGVILKGQDIIISLTRNVDHPLFRFSLELFSIIPERCIDRKTSKLLIEHPPSSGPYTLLSHTDSIWTFAKRSGFSDSPVSLAPETINFIYPINKSFESLMKELTGNAVVAATDLRFSDDDLNRLKSGAEVKFLPAIRFGAILLNPRVVPFNRVECRLAFAQIFRKALESKTPRIHGIEFSVFTKLLPGYLTPEELSSSAKVAISNAPDCHHLLKNMDFRWGKEPPSLPASFQWGVEQTSKVLGFKLPEPQVFSTRSEMIKAFLDGKQAVLTLGSGFWPLDPVGDLQMLFTPKMHSVLQDITSDTELQKLIEDAQSPGSNLQSVLSKINRHLFLDGKFNIFSHIRRFYFAKKGHSLRNVPIAVGTPAPWQLFIPIGH